ncbi:peroxidasin-like [Antedon mediterranea]|uniref:peroxidasin-like n=1 Tax=Antedon mediterranea TaxID=105859 RepID=UPI003AF458F3
MEAKNKNAMIIAVKMKSVSFLLLFLLYLRLLGTHAQTTSVTVGGDTVKVGEITTMTCSYTVSTNDALDRLVWFRADADGTPILGNPIVSSDTGETSNGRYSLSNDKDLMISAVEVNDAGNYLCRIITQNGQVADDYDELIVQYLDTPVVTPAQLSVKMDDTATFTTEPVGFPTPITITWIKGDATLDVSDTEKYPNYDATLTIDNVNETDEGDYKCRVENAAYMGVEGKLSNTATLSIGWWE